MPRPFTAEFDTRRDAEMTVEHLTQEHGIDPKAISIVPVTSQNSAGTQMVGSDNENGQDKGGEAPSPALAGRLRVSVEADDSQAEKVLESFATYGGKSVA